MRKILTALAITLLIAVCAGGAASAASVSVSPGTISTARGIAATATLVYQLTNGLPIACQVTSPRGQFIAGGTVVGENPVAVTIPVVRRTGMASEVLTIPVAVMERAINAGTASISYRRTFVGCDDLLHTSLAIQVTGEAGADFAINRMELYFDNRRAETTVQRNADGLKAYADIRFTGSGLLEGDWTVDGRIIQHVSRHVAYTRSITLESPSIPSLPTFVEGSHVVQFVITRPVFTMPLPSIVYFVEPREAKRAVPIALLSPLDNSVQQGSAAFSWQPADRPVLYLVGFYDSLESRAVFSALTREPSYTLPELLLRMNFEPGRQYFWKVLAFESEDSVYAESGMRHFTITEQTPPAAR